MSDPLLALALVGSRASGYNHDCASKLQGLLMALDEITELAEASGDPSLIAAAETAVSSARDLNALLNANRALTKPPVRTATTIRDLFAAAAQRASVRLEGVLPERAIEVALPAVTHAVAMLLDLSSGLAPNGRVAKIDDGIVTWSRRPALEMIAVATFALARDGGTLTVTPDGWTLSFA